MRTPVIALAAVIVATAPALADEEEDIARGRDLAERWCATCHVIGPDASGGDGGPSFESVARRPTTTMDGLRAWLAEPHEPMPDLNLTARDAEVLSRYIMSLAE